MKANATLLAACTLFVASCSSESKATEDKVDFTRVTSALESVEVLGIEPIHTLSGIYLAGQPDEAALGAARAAGLETVIDLRHADETEFDEQAVVEGLGLTYLHLPWNGAGELTDEVFDQVREMLRTAEKPILLHCKSANRVGAVWLPYRVLDEGASLADAVKEAKSVGLKKDAYEEKARDYVERKGS